MTQEMIRSRARLKPPEGLLRQDFYDTAIRDRQTLLSVVEEMRQDRQAVGKKLKKREGELLEERDEVMDLHEKIEVLEETLAECRRLKNCSNSAASRWKKENERMREKWPNLLEARWRPQGHKDKPWGLFRNTSRPHAKRAVARVADIPWLEMPE